MAKHQCSAVVCEVFAQGATHLPSYGGSNPYQYTLLQGMHLSSRLLCVTLLDTFVICNVRYLLSHYTTLSTLVSYKDVVLGTLDGFAEERIRSSHVNNLSLQVAQAS